jgi:hypothetical protein
MPGEKDGSRSIVSRLDPFFLLASWVPMDWLCKLLRQSLRRREWKIASITSGRKRRRIRWWRPLIKLRARRRSQAEHSCFFATYTISAFHTSLEIRRYPGKSIPMSSRPLRIGARFSMTNTSRTWLARRRIPQRLRPRCRSWKEKANLFLTPKLRSRITKACASRGHAERFLSSFCG